MKLHELLGSQKQVFAQAEKVRKDLHTTFEKRRELFRETITTFTEDGEGKNARVEAQSNLQSTVPAELKWLSQIVAKALDSEATIDEANTLARADVVLDNNQTILSNVPATQLLQLDKRLGELHQFVTAIPTLDPLKGFTPDKDKGLGVYVAREVTKRRTKKEQVPLVLIAPTKEHPGQAQLITKDVEIGTIVEREWSGLTTPAIKSTMLERVEELRRAVKQALARANNVEVKPVKIGQTVLDYIFGPVLG